MTVLKKIINHPVFKFITNRYVLIFLTFAVWMLFFDENSYLNHRDFDREINDLQNSIEFYKKEIEQNKQMIETLEDPLKLEKFAREVYRMKKENEDLFIIEFDTLK
ncbi:FtsB family cell division protein [Flavicella sediminum]|uniref:FtsB family cell division protein n=1 Tax=Flavicella sediminum TaxID=2585141 RepID=UPI00111EA537|nr:septum formation initiator family protein [Flavicella sediminum]